MRVSTFARTTPDVLLNMVIDDFKTMAGEGTGGYEVVNTKMQTWMAEAKKAKSQGHIDSVFFRRFARMMMVIKLAIVPTPNDTEGILDSIIEREINLFIGDVFGEEPDLKERGIGVIATALAEEILNLHLYLDTKDRREELKKKFLFGERGK